MADKDEPSTFTGGLEDALRQTLEGASEDDTPAAKEEAAEVEASPPDQADPDKAAEEDPAADESTEDEPADQQQAAPEGDEAASDESEPAAAADTETEEEDDGPDLQPILHWTQAEKDQFAKLNKAGKQIVLDAHKKLDRSYETKFQDIAKQRKELDTSSSAVRDYEKAVKPFEGLLASQGMTAPQAAAQIMALWQGLNDDPVGNMVKVADEFMVKRGVAGTSQAESFVRQMAKRLRVDLDGLDVSDDAHTETLSPEAEKIAQLEARLAESDRKFQTFQQGLQSREVSQGEALWNGFKADPANEHAGLLEDSITAYLGFPQAEAIADPREKLQWAYDQAVWANPETRHQLMEADRAKLLEQHEAERKAKEEKARAKVRTVPADKAKAASTQPKSAAPVAKVDPSDMPMFDLLKQNFEEQTRSGATRI